MRFYEINKNNLNKSFKQLYTPKKKCSNDHASYNCLKYRKLAQLNYPNKAYDAESENKIKMIRKSLLSHFTNQINDLIGHAIHTVKRLQARIPNPNDFFYALLNTFWWICYACSSIFF